MSNNNNKSNVSKKSKHTAGYVDVLKVLQKFSKDNTGTISYIFLEERIIFTPENPEGIIVQTKSTLHSDINNAVFMKYDNGKEYRRSSEEVYQVFEDTRHDLGADYFIIN